jgi:electron transfer flavoprotein beta subunit
MRIAVCIKQVPYSDQVKVDPNTHNLIRENTEMMINPADLNALTEAILLKREKQAHIDVYTMGADDAKTALYTALAMGADEAYLATDRIFAGGDSLGTAKVLSAAISQNGRYDLIICGSLAADGATGQVGPMIAALLDIPSVTNVKKINQMQGDRIRVAKAWKGKLAMLDMKIPGVVTISLGCNTPILPTLRNQMKVKKKEIHYYDNADLSLDPDDIGLAGAKSLVENTYIRENLGKQSQMLTGMPEEIAQQIYELIEKARKI